MAIVAMEWDPANYILPVKPTARNVVGLFNPIVYKLEKVNTLSAFITCIKICCGCRITQVNLV